MRLLSLELGQFRNYRALSLSFPEGTHVFSGANAQGKTNILEAIFLCTCARSHRTGRDEELIRQGESFYRVHVRFLTDQKLEEDVSIEYKAAAPPSKQPSRRIFYNGFHVPRVSELMGLFHAIIFAPEDLQIVKNGPAERRRFLDIMISRTDRAYFRDLQDFWSVLGQRNRLLKSMKEKPFGTSGNRGSKGSPDNSDGRGCGDDFFMDNGTQLDIWDQKLAEISSSILKKRLEYKEMLEQHAALSLTRLSSSREDLSISYRGISGLDPAMTKKEIESIFLKRLKYARNDDIGRGSTAQGPHRDDLFIALNGADSRIYASQGQQRSIVLALKMAELVILQKRTGEKPILLLDDVLSELDAARRSRLLEVIDGHQVFITCTDISRFEPLWGEPVHFYSVSDGRVLPAESKKSVSSGNAAAADEKGEK